MMTLSETDDIDTIIFIAGDGTRSVSTLFPLLLVVYTRMTDSLMLLDCCLHTFFADCKTGCMHWYTLQPPTPQVRPRPAASLLIV